MRTLAASLPSETRHQSLASDENAQVKGSGMAEMETDSVRVDRVGGLGEGAAEFDAGTEEATQMAAGLVPTKGAEGPEWDRALEGHSVAERRAADVYTLDV